jgi:hypothetical protein
MLNGGVASADNEVVFRTAKALADSGSWAIKDLERWPGFGTAKGLDGRKYSVFGAGESLALVPAVMLAELINRTGWYEHIAFDLPVSPYAGPAFVNTTDWTVASVVEARALRCVVSFFYVAAGSAAVFLFWLIIYRLTGSSAGATFGSLLFGIGSLQWPYAASLFSESLVVTLALWSFLLLVGECAPDRHGAAARPVRLVLSGLLLGAAVATHITAVLLVPFYAGYLLAKARMNTGSLRTGLRLAALHVLGVAVVGLLVFQYNAWRFGNILETGRTVDPGAIREFGYGFFVPPWSGMSGLMVSWGKGLLIYSPAVLLGLLGWRALFRSDKALGLTLAGIIITRWLFISSRFDWPGGYSLGPRLLVPVIPFALLPFGFWLADQKGGWRRQMIAAVGIYLCAVQQFYLQVGDVFNLFSTNQLYAAFSGVNVFKHWALYLSAEYAPIFHILEARFSPFVLKVFDCSTQTLFAYGTLLLTCITCAWVWVLNGRWRRNATPAATP